MNPKHIFQVPNDRKAIAPYNFVELPEKIVTVSPESLPQENRYYSQSENRYTGRIECTLTTESPLYIRCGLTAKEFRQEKESKDSPDFFYTNSSEKATKPVIPGSSLRGMLRTLVEIVSFSKIDRVLDRQLVYRAVGDRSSLGDKYREHLLKDEGGNTYSFLMHAGYIVKRGSSWAIRPASKIAEEMSFARIEKTDIPRGLERWYHLRNAFKISVRVEAVRLHPHNERRVKLRYAKAIPISDYPPNAVVVRTGSAPRKHMEFVFGLPHSDPNIDISISDEIIQEYKEQITDGQKQLLGDEAALQDMQPVFYTLEEGKLVFFGHAMMFRLPYEDSAKKFVPAKLYDLETISEQTDLKIIDIAEAIFGWVRDRKSDKDQARSGRVFVTDGVCTTTGQNIWQTGNFDKTLTPKILGNPKPTTFQHYLVQNNSDRRALKHYASQPEVETVIRGHKLYWHKGSAPPIELEGEASESQTTQIKPIKSGVSFDFKINFENLTDVEIGAILWVLTLAQNKEYRLSLGMGKPLGMGAVKIVSDLYLSNRVERYSKLFEGERRWATEENLADTKDLIAAFEKHILNHISLDDYPKDKNKGEIYTICELPRIQMLLAMLSWNAPSNLDRTTRYMEIERDIQKFHIGNPTKPTDQTVNEYKDRPVLPTPLQVMQWNDNRRLNNPSPSPSTSGGSGGISGDPGGTPKPIFKTQDKGKPIKKVQQSQQQQKPKDNSGGGNSAALARPQKPKL